jgi:hypothetical protein
MREIMDAAAGIYRGAGGRAWPVIAQTQQPVRTRRLAVLMGAGENDPEEKAHLSEFTQWLAELGWTDGRTTRSNGSAERLGSLRLDP